MKTFRPYRVPEGGHPAVQFLFAELNRQRRDAETLEKQSGVARTTVRNWRTRTAPQVTGLEACLRALGYTLVAQPIKGESDGQ